MGEVFGSVTAERRFYNKMARGPIALSHKLQTLGKWLRTHLAVSQVIPSPFALSGAERERCTEVPLQLSHPVVSSAVCACFSCFRKLPRPAAPAAWISSLHQLAVCEL